MGLGRVRHGLDENHAAAFAFSCNEGHRLPFRTLSQPAARALLRSPKEQTGQPAPPFIRGPRVLCFLRCPTNRGPIEEI